MENKFASILETLIGFFIFSPLPYVHLPQLVAHPGKRSFIFTFVLSGTPHLFQTLPTQGVNGGITKASGQVG